MKMFKALAIVSLLTAKCLATAIEVPNWSQYIQPLLTGMEGMSTMLDGDSQLYDAEDGKILALSGIFDARETQMNNAYLCIRSKFATLLTNLANCKTDTDNIVIVNQTEINYLIGQLTNLSQTTETEIANLKQERNAAQDQLAYLTGIYDQIVGEYGDLATTFITKATDTVNSYDEMIVKKETFLRDLNSLITRISQHSTTTAGGLSSVSTDIANVALQEAAVVASEQTAYNVNTTEEQIVTSALNSANTCDDLCGKP